MDLVIFDLETTGLSPADDDIIQIAAVRLRDGCLVPGEGFSTFVNPGRRIPSFITAYTGISDSHVRNAPPIREALAAFSMFTGETTLLAHNGHRFDMPFVRMACVRHAMPTRSVNYTDSIYLSKRVWLEHRRHGLDAVIERLGLDGGTYRRHDARGDVERLAEAVIRMCGRLTPDLGTLPIPLRLHQGALPA